MEQIEWVIFWSAVLPAVTIGTYSSVKLWRDTREAKNDEAEPVDV